MKVAFEKFKNFVPLYAFAGFCCLVFNLIVYNGNRLLTNGWTHYDLSLPIDGMIPFLTWTVVFYVLFFPFLGIGFLVVAKEGKAMYYRMLTGELIAKTICLAFFLALPTEMPDWPSGTFEIRNFFDWLMQFIYDHDQPNDLFPSIHCLESWLLMHKCLQCKKPNAAFKISFSVVAVCIMVSTLTTKQHLFVDILGGIAAAEIGQLVSRTVKGEKLFFRLEQLFRKRIPE